MYAMLIILLVLATESGFAQETPRIWSVQPDLRIGSVDQEDYSLTGVSDLTVGKDGSVFVAQPADGHIRVFDRNGRFVRTIGRKGQGPGEFLEVGEMNWIGDTLTVFDPQQKRLTLFSDDGQVLTTLRVPVPGLVGGYGPGAASALLEGGGAVGTPDLTTLRMNVEEPGGFPIYRLTRTGQHWKVSADSRARGATLGPREGHGGSGGSLPFTIFG